MSYVQRVAGRWVARGKRKGDLLALAAVTPFRPIDLSIYARPGTWLAGFWIDGVSQLGDAPAILIERCRDLRVDAAEPGMRFQFLVHGRGRVGIVMTGHVYEDPADEPLNAARRAAGLPTVAA